MYATESINRSLTRQINHWLMATNRLAVLENLASAAAWQGIDHTMEQLLKASFKQSIDEVTAFAQGLKQQLETGNGPDNQRSVRRGVLQLRDKYLKAEETIQFYTVAINSRTTPRLAARSDDADRVVADRRRSVAPLQPHSTAQAQPRVPPSGTHAGPVRSSHRS